MGNDRGILRYAIALFLVTLATRAVNNMVNTTVPLLARYDFLFSNALVGTLTAVGAAVNLLTIALVNTRLPSVLRRRVFIASNVLVPIILTLYYFSNPVSVWFIGVLTGFVYGMIMPNIMTSASIVGDTTSAERLLVLYTLALSTSLVVGPLAETYMLTHLSYRSVFLLFMPLALVSLALSLELRFPPDPPRRVGSRAGTSIIRNRGLISAMLANTTYSVPFAVFTAFIAIYAETVYHVAKYLAYFTFVPFFVMSFATRLYLTVRVPRKLFMPMLVSIALTIIGIAMVYLSPTFTVFLIAMAILGIPHGSTYPLSTLMISRGTGIEERNTANSYFAAFQGVLAIIVPMAFGYLAVDLGLRTSMALLLVPVVITAAAFIGFYIKHGVD